MINIQTLIKVVGIINNSSPFFIAKSMGFWRYFERGCCHRQSDPSCTYLEADAVFQSSALGTAPGMGYSTWLTLGRRPRSMLLMSWSRKLSNSTPNVSAASKKCQTLRRLLPNIASKPNSNTGSRTFGA